MYRVSQVFMYQKYTKNMEKCASQALIHQKRVKCASQVSTYL